MDCLICLEPIRGAPFQSAKRLTCECKVSTHEHCFRQYRAAKGHTECIICHNREYIRVRRHRPTPPPPSDDDEAIDLAFQARIARSLQAPPHPNQVCRAQPNLCEQFIDVGGKVLFAVASILIAYAQARNEIRR